MTRIVPYFSHRSRTDRARKRRRDFGEDTSGPRETSAQWYDIQYHKEAKMALTASEARKHLFPLIEQVNADRQPVEITSKRGDAVLMARVDYDALTETAYLLRAPANAQRLLESLSQARQGRLEVHDLSE